MSDLPESLPSWIREHIEHYQRDPVAAHDWDSGKLGGPGVLPTLLLTTTGAKSGQPRPLPLIYGNHGDQHVIIASKGGAPSHPSWFTNLQANPTCQVQCGADGYEARARIAEGEERAAIWDMMVGVYPPYTAYQQATEREIPVVVLERT